MPEGDVRVRLKHGLTSVVISGLDVRVLTPTDFIPATRGLRKFTITETAVGLWSVKSGRAKSILLRSDRLWVQGDHIRLGGEPAPHNLEVLANPKRGLDVIARLDLHSYLVGVLPAEMPVSWPLEALKAQAVAARSFVLRVAFDRRNKEYDVDSGIIDQMYRYLNEMRSDWVAKVDRAVKETRNQTLLDSQARALKAFYSADCGCQSEDPKFVWGEVADFASVKDPTCERRRPVNWSLSLAHNEVRDKLVYALNLPASTSLRTLQVGGRTPSGRVSEVIAAVEIGGQRKNISLSAQDFRRIFGFQKVRSASFSTRWEANDLEIAGSGSGHGVGLCQRGARSLAQEGLDYREILKTYYPRARLETLTAI